MKPETQTTLDQSSSSTSTMKPETQTTLDQSSSSTSTMKPPSSSTPMITRKHKRELASTSTIKSPPISAPNRNPKTRMAPNRPSCSILKENTCITSSPNSRPDIAPKRSAPPLSFPPFSETNSSPKTQTAINRPSSSILEDKTCTTSSNTRPDIAPKRSAPSLSFPPIIETNPSPKTQTALNRPSYSTLEKNTCTTSPNTRLNIAPKRSVPPSSFTPIIETNPNPKPNDEVIRIITDKMASPTNKKKQKKPSFTCLLCFWSKNDEDRFNVKGCDHFYCTDCIEKYVSSKLENNVAVIGCPALGCGNKLELELCRKVLSREVFDRWGDALCESLIEVSQKFYCPFKDCSALLVNDGGAVVMESECPNCRRLFCAQCKVPWHAEKKCEEFLRLNKEEQNDKKMKALAEREKWPRCPSCSFYVQKITGCNFIRCRCGTTFCYFCGKAPMKDHYCANCRR